MAATQAQSPFAFPKTSPLDSIVDGRSKVLTESPSLYDFERPYPQKPSNLQITPPRPSNIHLQSPVSPLLHGQFSRSSTATASSFDNNSLLDRSSSFDSRNIDNTPQYHDNDDESIYSSYTALGPAPRESWHSAASAETVRQTAASYSPNYIDIDSMMLELSPNKFIPQRAAPQPPVPTVVVSTPVAGDYEPDTASRGGRTPIIRPITSNFSRPVRAPPSFSNSRTPLSSPPLPSDPRQEEQKRLVLERNRPNSRPNTPSNIPSQPFGPQDNSVTVLSKSSPNSPLPSIVVQPWKQGIPSQGQAMRSRSPQLFVTTSQSTSPGSPNTFMIPPHPSTVYSPSESGLSSNSAAGSRPTTLSNYSSPEHLKPLRAQGSPPVQSSSPLGSLDNNPSGLIARSSLKRENSPVSLYSNYSYYQYDSTTPSPTAGTFKSQEASSHASRLQAHFQPPSKATSRSVTPSDRVPLSEATASTPQDFLQLGIQHHEANRLPESAACFEKSAKSNGGCGVGMLMWGLALRHGWGCAKNEKVGFKWLQKAAEHAVEDLESSRGGTDVGAVQTELLLAIYEVGQCFFQGWGVPKDQKMAVSYYTVAARLGDADAQCDLAFCLANGKGCKKDRKEAAKWYRAAVAQGQSDIGLAWIYKEKFK